MKMDFSNEAVKEMTADFEDKSLYIKLPCSAGDVVYFVGRHDIKPCQVQCIEYSQDAHSGNWSLYLTGTDAITGEKYFMGKWSLGVCVFLTYEEAKKALEELQ